MTDWEFVFDGVVGFLTSPMWNVPIVTFIEKNCVVFEPSDENELAYTQIHKEYGELVEELLTCYLKDVGITEDQFVSACEAGSRDSAKVPDRSIFEQVWAGEDFHLFKKIMVKKNLDLELQALHMIQQRNGIVPQVFASENEKSSKKKPSHQTNEEALLKEVMERSRQEFEKDKGKRKEIERMEKTLALSKEESERLHELAERELNELERMVTLSLRLENARERDETSNAKKETKESSDSKTSSQKSKGKPVKVNSSGKPSAKETPKPASKKEVQSSPQPGAIQAKPSSSTKQNREGFSSPKPVAETVIKKESKNAVSTQANPSSPKQRQSESKLPPVKTQRTPAEAAADWISSAKAEVNISSSNNLTDSKNGEKTPMDNEIIQRAAYMRIQREKLLNLKKQERAKRLQKFEDEQPVKRPMSSRVAQRVAQGCEVEKPATSAVSKQEQKTLAMSRALRERLKKEVINQTFEK